MAVQLELTQEQIDRYGRFIELKKQIEFLKKETDEIREEIDAAVRERDIDSSETVMIFIDDNVIELSKPTQSLKFNYDIAEFINETNKYDVLQVSTTLARKHLTADEIDVYFKIEPGSRKLTIK